MPEELGTFTYGEPTLDERARALIAAGKMKKAPVFEGSPLPEAEQARLRAMSPEERFDERWFRAHPVTGTVTTNKSLWDANGGKSPNPSQVERMMARIESSSNGRRKFGRTESGKLMIIERAEDGSEVRTVLNSPAWDGGNANVS